MKTTITTAFMFCIFFAAQGVVPAGEIGSSFKQEKDILNRTLFGPKAPQIIRSGPAAGTISLKFSSTSSDAAAASLKKSALKINKGFFFSTSFKADAQSSNPYPRIAEQPGTFSIHTISSDMSLKLMIFGKDKKNYAQIVIPEIRPEIWHTVRVAFDPGSKKMYLQVDNSAILSKEVVFDLQDYPENAIIFGAGSMTKSNRGFDGLISGFRVVNPYVFNTKDFAEEKDDAITSVEDTAGVNHITVCYMRGRHLAFPGIAQFPDGILAAVFREGEGHVCPYGRICITYSKDGGENWSAPVAVSDTASDERDPSIQTLSDGRILLTHAGWNSWMSSPAYSKKYKGETAYVEQTGPKNYGGSRFLFSSDNGQTWTHPIRVKAFCPHGPFFHNGKIYSPTLSTKGDTRYVDFWEADREAQNWKKISTIATSASSFSKGPVYEEPHSLVLKDGTFVTAIRVPNEGHMLISFSKDEGKSWSTPVKTKVKGFPQHLLQLKDGRLLASYGYRYHPYGIRACISNDGGKTWDIENEIILCSNGNTTDLGYPVSIELKNGKVLTVYYYNTQRRTDCFIEGALYTP